MSKIEKIVVDENYAYPNVSKVKLPKDKLYKEKGKVREREINFDKSGSIASQVTQIDKDLGILNNRYNVLLKEYLLHKLFKYVKIDLHDTFKKDWDNFEKYVKKFKNDYMLVSNYFNTFRVKPDSNNNTIEEIFEEVTKLFDFISGLNDDLNKIKKKYFHEFRLSSYALIRNKSLDQIEDLINRVDDEINNYKDIGEAFDYIIYNSGKEITDVVNGIVNAKKKVNGNVDYHYFLSTDDIIAFHSNEWIDLFVKINYVKEKLGSNIVYTKDFENKYRILETRYSIVIIYMEINWR